jgi:CheY-like chemotaxis protein
MRILPEVPALNGRPQSRVPLPKWNISLPFGDRKIHLWRNIDGQRAEADMAQSRFAAQSIWGNAMATSNEAVSIEYSDLPTVLIFTDDPAGSAATREAVEEAGGRVGAVVPVVEALERLAVQARLAAVVIDVRGEGTPALDALLAAVDRGAAAGSFAGVVIVPTDLIDAASAAINAAQITILCEPTPLERVAAVGAAIQRKAESFADVGSGLKELADEVARIAKTLATLANESPSRGGVNGGNGTRAAGGQASDAALIRAIIRVRRMREQFFPADLFADPAWDMLLDLTAARLEGRMVAVSSLCIASAVPPTTALRWIKTLTDGKLFERVADSNDGRRVFIELTEVAETGMLAYLAQMQRVLTLR